MAKREVDSGQISPPKPRSAYATTLLGHLHIITSMPIHRPPHVDHFFDEMAAISRQIEFNLLD